MAPKRPIVRLSAKAMVKARKPESAAEIAAQVRDRHALVDQNNELDAEGKRLEKEFWGFLVENMRDELDRILDSAAKIENETDGGDAASIAITTGLFSVILRELSFLGASNLWRAKRVRDLETRIKELESRNLIEYKDVWRDDQRYDRNDIVTHGGSAWIAKSQSVGQIPGKSAGLWKLMVKRGADGKDAGR